MQHDNKNATHLERGHFLLLCPGKARVMRRQTWKKDKRSHERKARNSTDDLTSSRKLGKGAPSTSRPSPCGLVSRVWAGRQLPLVQPGREQTAQLRLIVQQAAPQSSQASHPQAQKCGKGRQENVFWCWDQNAQIHITVMLPTGQITLAKVDPVICKLRTTMVPNLLG